MAELSLLLGRQQRRRAENLSQLRESIAAAERAFPDYDLSQSTDPEIPMMRGASHEGERNGSGGGTRGVAARRAQARITER